jgi:hypothetical protein
MSGFNSVAELASAEDEFGRFRYATWRKSPTQVTTAGVWFDLSMSPGNPVPQYYAASPLVSVAMKQSTDGGLFHGGNVAPQTKHLRSLMALTATAAALPMPMRLLDYLLFYPFIDEGTTDEQVLTNSVPLPRYADGEGVQIMAVSVASRTGGQSFITSYTNQDGVAGRITTAAIQNSVSVTGSIVTSQQAAELSSCFLTLQSGDTGVRSIESVTMLGVDVGLFTLVLVKPLAQMSIFNNGAPVEVDFLKDFSQCPVIQDDAYLNFICCPQGTLAATPIHGMIKTIFN